MRLPSFHHPPTETEPVGLAKYLDLFFTNAAPLLVTNLLFLLSCIPVVTSGPGLIALNRLVYTLMDGKKVDPVRDYFDELKKNLRFGFVITLTLFPLMIWSLFMALSAYKSYVDHGTFLLQFFFFVCLYVLSNCFAMYFLPLLTQMNTDKYTILTTAMKLCILGLWRTILGGLGVSILSVLILLSIPKSLPLLLLIHFSFSVYHCVFFSSAVIKKYICSEDERTSSSV